MLGDSYAPVRRESIESLIHLKAVEALGAIEALLNDEDSDVRRYVARAKAALGSSPMQ